MNRLWKELVIQAALYTRCWSRRLSPLKGFNPRNSAFSLWRCSLAMWGVAAAGGSRRETRATHPGPASHLGEKKGSRQPRSRAGDRGCKMHHLDVLRVKQLEKKEMLVRRATSQHGSCCSRPGDSSHRRPPALFGGTGRWRARCDCGHGLEESAPGRKPGQFKQNRPASAMNAASFNATQGQAWKERRVGLQAWALKHMQHSKATKRRCLVSALNAYASREEGPTWLERPWDPLSVDSEGLSPLEGDVAFAPTMLRNCQLSPLATCEGVTLAPFA